MSDVRLLSRCLVSNCDKSDVVFILRLVHLGFNNKELYSYTEVMSGRKEGRVQLRLLQVHPRNKQVLKPSQLLMRPPPASELLSDMCTRTTLLFPAYFPWLPSLGFLCSNTSAPATGGISGWMRRARPSHVFIIQNKKHTRTQMKAASY